MFTQFEINTFFWKSEKKLVVPERVCLFLGEMPMGHQDTLRQGTPNLSSQAGTHQLHPSDLQTADTGLEPLWKLLKPEVLSTSEDGMWAGWVQESKARLKTWEPLGTAENPHRLAGRNTS